MRNISAELRKLAAPGSTILAYSFVRLKPYIFQRKRGITTKTIPISACHRDFRARVALQMQKIMSGRQSGSWQFRLLSGQAFLWRLVCEQQIVPLTGLTAALWVPLARFPKSHFFGTFQFETHLPGGVSYIFTNNFSKDWTIPPNRARYQSFAALWLMRPEACSYFFFIWVWTHQHFIPFRQLLFPVFSLLLWYIWLFFRLHLAFVVWYANPRNIKCHFQMPNLCTFCYVSFVRRLKI